MKYLKDRNSILSLLYHTGFYPASGKNRAFSLDKTGRVSSMYNSESSQWLMPRPIRISTTRYISYYPSTGSITLIFLLCLSHSDMNYFLKNETTDQIVLQYKFTNIQFLLILTITCILWASSFKIDDPFQISFFK